ncbi:MAG TPA: acyl carrier protein [Allosphingosinicella sp.]|nr:acyl carrier protein [Allosphingosinicella sp.]
MDLENRLAEIIRKEAELAGGRPGEITPDTILADTGLDSLGFATLMVTIEQEFGLDPFGGRDEISYPETFGELLRLYRREASSES